MRLFNNVRIKLFWKRLKKYNQQDNDLKIINVATTKAQVHNVIYIKEQAYRILSIVEGMAMIKKLPKDYTNKFEENGILERVPLKEE